MYRNIVVGTDGSMSAERAVDRAGELAGLTGATVHLVSVYRMCAAPRSPNAGGVAMAWDDEARIGDRRRRLDATAARLAASGLDVRARLAFGDPASALVATAADVCAELVVVGDRGVKGLRHLFGSVPGSVTHNAPVDVLVVRTTEGHNPSRKGKP